MVEKMESLEKELKFFKGALNRVKEENYKLRESNELLKIDNYNLAMEILDLNSCCEKLYLEKRGN